VVLILERANGRNKKRRRVVVSVKDTVTIADTQHTSNVHASLLLSHTSARQNLAVGLVYRLGAGSELELATIRGTDR